MSLWRKEEVYTSRIFPSMAQVWIQWFYIFTFIHYEKITHYWLIDACTDWNRTSRFQHLCGNFDWSDFSHRLSASYTSGFWIIPDNTLGRSLSCSLQCYKDTLRFREDQDGSTQKYHNEGRSGKNKGRIRYYENQGRCTHHRISRAQGENPKSRKLRQDGRT